MLTLPNTLSLENLEENMVFVAGGEFEMGSEEYSYELPIHKVHLSNFEICRYPVSQRLWREVLGANPVELAFQNPHRPVERVSWKNITENFLPVLCAKTGIDAYCLPTEAQWEYAARGGRGGNHSHTYAGSDYLKEVGWYRENSHRETQPLALKRPNALGLYGMSGNVWEWCQDRYDGDYYQTLKNHFGTQAAPDPGGTDRGNRRMVRGGSWLNYHRPSRVADRFYNFLDYRDSGIGFRLCRYPRG